MRNIMLTVSYDGSLFFGFQKQKNIVTVQGEIEDALKKITGENINIISATYRWLAFHSMLSEARGDGLIMGFSKFSQLQQNIETIKQGPLPNSIVDAFSEAWSLCKCDAPEYFTYYKSK